MTHKSDSVTRRASHTCKHSTVFREQCACAVEKAMASHSSTLAWKISWTEEPVGLQSMGSQRVRHDLETNTHLKYIYCHSAYLTYMQGTS